MAMYKSLKDMLDYIDAGTYTYVIPHSDGKNGIVESEFVFIPPFKTAGFSAAMQAKGFVNGVTLGNVSIAKFPASHPLATETSKGGVDGADWGAGYAAVSKAMKSSWTYVDADEAKTACELMDIANSAASTTTSAGGLNYLIDTAWAAKLVGKKIEIVEGGVTYYRRITTIGQTDRVYFTPDLPYGLITAIAGANNDIRYTRKNSTTNYVNIAYVDGGAVGLSVARTGAGTVGDPYVITVTYGNADKLASTAITAIRADADCNAVVHVMNADGNDGSGDLAAMGASSLAQFIVSSGSAYTVKRFGLMDPYDWATLKYVTAMRYAVNAMPYPKGNNQYGRDVNDADEIQNYGLPDPDYDDASHEITKVLTGTGPLSWMHNGQENGIWGISNTWQWILLQMGNVVDYVIDAGFMGEGYTMPISDGYWDEMETAGDCGIGNLALIKGTPGGAGDADFDQCHYWRNTGLRAFRVGGGWSTGADAGVFDLHAGHAPSTRYVACGFRASL